MADPMGGAIRRVTTARKETKDGTIERVVTVTLELDGVSEDDLGDLFELQGKQEVRVTFVAVQGVLPLRPKERSKRA